MILRRDTESCRRFVGEIPALSEPPGAASSQFLSLRVKDILLSELPSSVEGASGFAVSKDCSFWF